MQCTLWMIGSHQKLEDWKVMEPKWYFRTTKYMAMGFLGSREQAEAGEPCTNPEGS